MKANTSKTGTVVRITVSTEPRPMDATTVKHAAQGSWAYVLGSLTPEIETAVLKPGKHSGPLISDNSLSYTLS